MLQITMVWMWFVPAKTRVEIWPPMWQCGAVGPSGRCLGHGDGSFMNRLMSSMGVSEFCSHRNGLINKSLGSLASLLLSLLLCDLWCTPCSPFMFHHEVIKTEAPPDATAQSRTFQPPVLWAKWTFFTYKLPSFRYSVTEAQNGLRHKCRKKLNEGVGKMVLT